MAEGQNQNDPSARLETIERWSGKATLLILAGIVLEIALLFVFPHHSSPWELGLTVLALGAIGVGLVGEYVCILKTIVASGEQKAESDTKLAEALIRASNAEQELIRFRTPRRVIFAPATSAFVQRMSAHKGVQFDLGRDAGGESMHFLWDLAHALIDAGWLRIPWQDTSMVYTKQGPLTQIGMVGATNVEIHIHSRSRETLGPAAADLISALTEIGIAATDEGSNAHSINANAIHILIGPKG